MPTAGARLRWVPVLVLVATMLASFDATAYAAGVPARCNGKERWPVKTGADSGAAQVDASSVTPTTIVALRAIPAPAKRPQDKRASATETTVFSVNAVLTNYKMEPDQDYHLVIADENRTRMVVEVPDTACIHGPSPFAGAISAARKVVDDRFHVGTSFLTTDIKIPVRVTGVGFFDAKGHGTGGTPNGIELHPVLKIEFTSGTTAPVAPAAPSAAGQQLLGDPGFEAGPNGSSWSTSGNVISSSTKTVGAHGGKYYAWLGGYGTVHTDTLTQQVTLPSSATRITLSYWIAIDTQEHSSRGSFESTEVFDTLTVEVRSNGGRSDVLVEYSNRNARASYSSASADLTPYKGQTITLVFTAVEDKSLLTSFFLDDLSVDAE